jgi:hypothetical protein
MYARLNAPPSPEFKALGDAARAAIARGAFADILRGDGDASSSDSNNDAAAVRAKAKAAAIIRAGERARSDGSNERPEPTGKAKLILDATKKAHRKIGDDR